MSRRQGAEQLWYCANVSVECHSSHSGSSWLEPIQEDCQASMWKTLRQSDHFPRTPNATVQHRCLRQCNDLLKTQVLADRQALLCARRGPESTSVACNQFCRIAVKRQHASVELMTPTTVACKRTLAMVHTVAGSGLYFVQGQRIVEVICSS